MAYLPQLLTQPASPPMKTDPYRAQRHFQHLADLRQANQQNPQVLLLEARAHSQSGDKEAARATCEQVVDFNQLSVNLAYVREQARDLLESL